MILIADSGSTKTDWVVAEKGRVVFQHRTCGMNPCVQSYDEIERTVEQTAMELAVQGFPLQAVYYYGAGCTPEKLEMMTGLLQRYWGQAVHIEVHSDLNGAARAVCGKADGVACILGTGSNSCLFLNGEIAAQTPALGYILGDEGSGTALGKRFLNGILKGSLPASLRNEFFEAMETSPQDILYRVYQAPMPNRFLASLSPFISAHIDIEGVNELVTANFQDFLERNIVPYHRTDLSLGVVGSVAFHYQSQLKTAASALQFSIGKIEKSPVEGLVRYHSTTR